MPNERTWDKELQWWSQLNNSANKTIDDIPFHTLFVYYVNFEHGLLIVYLLDNDQIWTNSVSLQPRIRDRITKEHEMWIERNNLAHTKVKYSVDKIVYLKRAPKYSGQPTKLQPN